MAHDNRFMKKHTLDLTQETADAHRQLQDDWASRQQLITQLEAVREEAEHSRQYALYLEGELAEQDCNTPCYEKRN